MKNKGLVVFTAGCAICSAFFGGMYWEQRTQFAKKYGETEVCQKQITASSSPKDVEALLVQIADILKENDNRDLLATAGVLYALSGCLNVGQERAIEMLRVLVPFIEGETIALKFPISQT